VPDLLKVAMTVMIVALEWWAIQPYHEPMLARLWLWMMKFCYWMALHLGRLGMRAERGYYECVEAGQ
jgi:hypothetical protein